MVTKDETMMMPTVARIWTKKATQQTLNALRKNGYEVKKKSQGRYKVYLPEGNVLMLEALIGSNNYLVRYCTKLFEG